ncbi:MAG: hypothetical protein M0R17_05765 [Candidatus Omnitrophica bacterium]|jgi:transposase|nr:hypothetical protein [Candidatus Omnitrophota bacterium]
MKLTKEQINEIKQMRMEGRKQNDIKEKFNVSLSTIQYHTNEKTKNGVKERAKNYSKNLTKDKKNEIYNKKKEYSKKYQKNKYNTDEIFRLKHIQAVKDSKKRKEVGECQT